MHWREGVNSCLGEFERKFLEFLQKHDDRFNIVLHFQENYNQFIDKNPDMIEELATKEEMHQRVEDLWNQLLDIIDIR